MQWFATSRWGGGISHCHCMGEHAPAISKLFWFKNSCMRLRKIRVVKMQFINLLLACKKSVWPSVRSEKSFWLFRCHIMAYGWLISMIGSSAFAAAPTWTCLVAFRGGESVLRIERKRVMVFFLRERHMPPLTASGSSRRHDYHLLNGQFYLAPDVISFQHVSLV